MTEKLKNRVLLLLVSGGIMAKEYDLENLMQKNKKLVLIRNMLVNLNSRIIRANPVLENTNPELMTHGIHEGMLNSIKYFDNIIEKSDNYLINEQSLFGKFINLLSSNNVNKLPDLTLDKIYNNAKEALRLDKSVEECILVYARVSNGARLTAEEEIKLKPIENLASIISDCYELMSIYNPTNPNKPRKAA